jgi:hypothetical protein
VNTASLLRWQRTYERRARRWWTSRWIVAAVAGGALAALVAWRAQSSVIGASHVWLAGTFAAFALAFMRVPFHLYWRPDAALLAQLPIEGTPLFDVALARCVLAAAATTLAALAGAIPLAALDAMRVGDVTRELAAMPIAGDPVPRLTPLAFYARHAELAVVLGLAAALLLPAVAAWAASLVAGGTNVLHAATALGGAPTARRTTAPHPPGANASATLGAIPGFASAVVFVLLFVIIGWLNNTDTALDAVPVLSAIAATSVVAIVAMRRVAGRVMGTILRDVSALDRQRLATLEIHPPTALERLVAALIGEAGLPYRKDARLMRRRYPMAFALGALAFIVLAIVGLSRPADPMPWLVGTLAAAAMYAIALAGRLRRPPIELPRLTSTLPIASGAVARAKLAWIVTWIVVFVAIPTSFALARTL